MHLMLDLETLGTGPNAAVIEIGAVLFEATGRKKILNNEVFQIFVDPPENARFTLGTAKWWFGQSQAARDRFIKAEAYPESVAIESLCSWPSVVEGLGGWNNLEGVWSHGAVFDQPILESLFQRNGKRLPWSYGLSRDTRTLFSLAGGYPSIDTTGFIQHSAVDDCIMQAMMVQKAYELLGK